MEISFSQLYPNISRWVEEQGWVEFGADEYSKSLVRALDDGGLVWESGRRLKKLDDALAALEVELEKWFEQNG